VRRSGRLSTLALRLRSTRLLTPFPIWRIATRRRNKKLGGGRGWRYIRAVASVKLFPAVLACLLAAVTAQAQRAVAPADAKARTAAIFARYNRTDSPGCAVATAIDGVPAFTAAYGMADMEHAIALTPDSIFEAGSVSKQFTAAAILLLAQQGKLSLDDPARKYLPELPDYGTPITIRHLLTHTSGLRDWGSVEAIAGWPRTTRAYTQSWVLDIASRQRSLNYPPGAAYSYCNTGYNLAAILVGRVAGQTFAAFTEQAIFAPLGMDSTGWRDDYRRIVRNRAIAYNDSGSTMRQEMPFEDVHGQGGLLTTVADLLRWNQNYVDAKVGGRALVQAQQQPARLNDGQAIGYALGLFVGSWRGIAEVNHSGATAAYRSWLARYPDQGLSVAILCNASSANTTELGRKVAELYLPSAGAPRAQPPTIAVDAAALQARAGLYRSVRDHSTRVLEIREGQLRQGNQVLRPIAPNLFAIGEEGQVIFQGSRMRTAGIDAGDWYERVERVSPTEADLQAYAGDYSSDEAEAAFQIAVESNGLVLRRRPYVKTTLIPTYRDAFTYDGNALRFLRDASGRVTEFSIGEARVWDLRFRKVR
jgi:CubicO group peptidase (beta-lactamase class C family)